MSRIKILVLVFSAAALGLSGCSFVTDAGKSMAQSAGFVAGDKFRSGEDNYRSAETLTPEEEYYLGRAVAAKILAKYKQYPDKLLAAYVTRIGLAVAAKSERPETFGGYHFAVLDTDEINAISAPGGFVFITKGLLRLLPDEDALASVLGHEVGHIAKRHGLAAIKVEDFGDFIDNGRMVMSALDCTGCTSQVQRAFVRAVGDIYDVIMAVGYNKDQEYEADDASALSLAGVGYDPQGVVRAFQAIDGKMRSGGWLSSHPGLADRIKSAEDRIASLKSVSSPGARKTRFQVATARLMRS